MKQLLETNKTLIFVILLVLALSPIAYFYDNYTSYKVNDTSVYVKKSEVTKLTPIHVIVNTVTNIVTVTNKAVTVPSQPIDNKVDTSNLDRIAKDLKQVLTKTNIVSTPQIVSRPQLAYPLDASKNNISGTVTLQGVVGIDGTVQSVVVVDAQPTLNRYLVDEAVNNLKQTKFSNITSNTTVELQYDFTLK